MGEKRLAAAVAVGGLNAVGCINIFAHMNRMANAANAAQVFYDELMKPEPDPLILNQTCKHVDLNKFINDMLPLQYIIEKDITIFKKDRYIRDLIACGADATITGDAYQNPVLIASMLFGKPLLNIFINAGVDITKIKFANNANILETYLDIDGGNPDVIIKLMNEFIDRRKHNEITNAFDWIFLHEDPHILFAYDILFIHKQFLKITEDTIIRFLTPSPDGNFTPDLYYMYRILDLFLYRIVVPRAPFDFNKLLMAFLHADCFQRQIRTVSEARVIWGDLLKTDLDFTGLLESIERISIAYDGQPLNINYGDPATGDTFLIATAKISEVWSDEKRQLYDFFLSRKADKNAKNNEGKTALDIETQPEFKNLIETANVVKMWEGWSRSDAERLDAIFSDEGAKDYSVCPVCLKHAIRVDGCMYMHHNCSTQGGYYHKTLYERFSKSGEIEWCTFCGRLCNSHRHFENFLASEFPTKYAAPAPTDQTVFFQADCRGANGGGGIPEKMLRFRQLRFEAKALQDEVGLTPREEALDRLVEKMWNAPSKFTDLTTSQKHLNEKKWNFESANIFPANTVAAAATNTNNATEAPNIPRPAANAELLPILDAHGSNAVSLNDDVAVVYFYHRIPDGTIVKHSEEGVGLPTLVRLIKDYNNKFGTDDFGACPIQCGAILHPDEVQRAFELLGATEAQMAVAAEYRQKFNRKFVQRLAGGRRGKKTRRQSVRNSCIDPSKNCDTKYKTNILL